MNAIDFRNPVAQVSGFKGLWQRGMEDACPPDHLTECMNSLFVGNDQVRVRYPLDISAQFAGKTIVSFYGHIASFESTQVTNYLVMDSAGTLYDDSLTELAHWPGADDFCAVDVYGRVFLSPKRMGRALAREFTYYYDGQIHKLAGAGPTVALSPTASPDAGTVDIGRHYVSVSFLYRYGYTSPPAPVNHVDISIADKAISLHDIPTSDDPAVVGRVILVSKADEIELFRLPPLLQPLLNDNTLHTATIDFTDVALVDSADYLNDLATEIPSCSAIKFYRGRLVLVGQGALPTASAKDWNVPEKILVSTAALPDEFSTVDGIISVPRDYILNAPNTAVVLRNSLYIMKPHRCFVTTDNDDVPNTWSIDMIDAVIGAFDTGISTSSLATTSQDVFDSVLICDETGLMVFNGTFGARLSYKIDALWNQIDDDEFWRVQIAHDPWLKQVYILAPVCNEYIMLFMDYKDGLTPSSVKWAVWRFRTRTPTKILISNLVETITSGNVTHRLEMAAGTDTIYKLQPDDKKIDLGNIPIHQIVATAPVPTVPGAVTFFTGLRFRIYGAKKIKIYLYNEDRSRRVEYMGFTLNYKGQDLTRMINFVNEKMIVAFESTEDFGWFHLHRIDVFGRPMWQMRPALTQAL